jgi:hypothetical protein
MSKGQGLSEIDTFTYFSRKMSALLGYTGCKGNVYHALPGTTQKRSGEPHYRNLLH